MSKKLFDDNDKIYAQKEDNNNKIYSVSDDEAKQRQVTFQTEDGKSYTTSLAAYQAIRGGYIDEYSPQDFEKEAVNHFKDLARQQKHAEDEARKEREPDNPVQAVLHSIGYTGGKILSGATDMVADVGNLALAGIGKAVGLGAKILSPVLPGKSEDVIIEKANQFADKQLNSPTLGDVWSESVESRYKVPDWLRNHLGPTATNLGAMLPATIVEVATAGAAPGFESIAAKAALNKAALGTTAKSLGKNLLSKFKVAPLRTSEVVFGAGATASATKEAYAETGDFSKSLTKGVLNGLGEIFTERLFGGLGGTGIGADDAYDLINVGKSKILSKIASNKVGKKALDLTFEGLEEVIMAGAEPIFKKLTTNPDAKLSDLYKESDFSDSFLQGVLLSAFANVTTATVGKAIDTSNKHSAIRKLNKDAEAVNAKIASESDKITPLKHNATEEQIQNLNYEIQRKDAIVNFNAVADATNAMFKDDADKFELLKYDSTEAEIRERQEQLTVFANAYEELLLDEVVSTNPEVAKAIQDKVALESDDGAETNTTPATQENTTTIGTNQSVSTETPTVSVGETFIDKKLNQQIKVVARGTDTATIETTNLSTGNRVTKKLPVQLVDKMKVDSRYSPVNTSVNTTANANNPEASETSNIKTISLTKVGNRYEVYGADAVELAEELDLETTKRVIDGVETDVLLLPKRFAEGLNAEYGDKYNFVTSDSESTGATEVNQTSDGVNQVVDAMRETFEPGAEEKILSSIPPHLPRSVETFAQNLISAYNEHGNIGHISKLFVDGGKKVMSVMDGVLGKSVEVESKETSSHKKNEAVTNESNTTVDEAIGSALNEKVLKNEQESDTIKSKAETSDSKSESVFIDDRTYEDVSSRKVKAFQFENPEVKPFFKAIAQELRNDLKNTTKGERFATGDFNAGTQEFTGTKRFTSESIARIKDATNATYDEIDNALERIINDEGQENVALAKKIELVMDDMLSDGYTTFDGYEISADNEYLALKEELSGKEYETDSSESEELPLDLDNGTTQSVSGDIKEATEENSVGREDNGNERRNNITARSLGRSIGESAVKSGGSLYETTGKAKGNGGQRTDTESSRRIYAEHVRNVQGSEIRQQGVFRCEFIKPEHYTDDMRAIEESNLKQGIKTYFFLDNGEVAFKSHVKFKGAIYGNEIYIQCNHERVSPEAINKHEIIHRNYNTEDVKRVREYINDNLTEEEKRYIIDVMYSRYAESCKGDKNKIFEEFVCDVLSGENSYSEKFANVAQEYWSNHTDLVESYSANDYTESIDAGGEDIDGDSEHRYSLSSMGATFFGDESISSEEFEKMLEDGSYKSQKGYRDYVKDCVEVYRQSRGIKGMLSGSEVKKIEQQIEGIMRVAIAAKKAGYDIFDDGETRSKKDSKKRLLFSSLEPNSDYVTSSDISTICDKRINFSEIYEDIVRLEESRGVPADERFFSNVDNYFILHKLMADKGLTAPCEECYVESMRKNLAPMANAFIELVTETDANNKDNAQLYNQDGNKKGEIKKNNSKLRDKVRGMYSESGTEIVSGKSNITVDSLTVQMLTTADGLAQLKLQAPYLYEAFNSFYGQSKPKMPRQATPFRPGELIALMTDSKGKIKTSLVNKIVATGGFRLQSYSDFQIKNYVDVLQTIFEASMVGLNGHAYTKVPAFLEATDGTNLKRNISIFMYEDGGNWKLDKKNSFPMELEDIYALVASDDSGNTSIIAVSQNADMSAWIMANDLVGYGIPFHKSGLKMEVVRARVVKTPDGREILGYANQKDHTAQQSEVYKKTLSEKKKENTKVKNPINIYSFWDFKNKDNLSKKELIEKNLKRYIDECNKRQYRPKFREYLMNNEDVLNNTLEYAKELGFVSQDATIDDISFKHDEYTIPYGYYKFLGDFGMFKPDGSASPIERLSLENYDFDKAVDFFEDSSKLRINELLQQFENGEVRDRYRKMVENGKMTAEQLEDVLKERRNQIANEVVEGRYDIDEGGEYDGRNNQERLGTVYNVHQDEDAGRRNVLLHSTHQGGENRRRKGQDSSETDRGTESEIRFSIDTYAPTFYSHMSRTIDGMKDGKYGANSVVPYLKGKGVKNEELKWSGIEEFLDGKKSVTKAELQEFVANNQLEIVEETSNTPKINLRKLGDDEYAAFVWYDENGKEMDRFAYDYAGELVSQKTGESYLDVETLKEELSKKSDTTRWKQYKLDGGENYREIVFKMPNSTYSNQMMRIHWGDDAEGILAHARVQDIDVDGKKMLFIEEIQSDWHNEGHKKGYSPRNQDRRITEAKRIYNTMNSPTTNIDEFLALQDEFEQLQFECEQEGIDIIDFIFTVPDAPFHDNYHEYALKRIIRMAAEQGYDSIGWTPAEIQMDRWNPGRLTNAELGIKDAKNPDVIAFEDGYRIEYDQDIPKFLNKYGKKWGAKVGKTEVGREDGGWYEVEGTTVWSMDITDAMKDSVLYEGQARYSLADDGILDLEDLWKEANETYGTIPKGENPVRDVDVPKKISKKDVVSHFARTMLEAGVTPDWAVSEFEKAILNGEMTHEVIEDKKTHKKVVKKIKEIGFEEALRDWDGNTRQGIISKENLVLGMELYNQAITNKDVRNAMKIAAELAAEATRAGQTLQACRMLKLMTPDGQLYYLEKSIQKMNEEFKEKLGDKFKDIELDESLMEEFFKETDETKRNEIYDKICQNIADQIPSTFRDHWDSWRYLAMLGNIRTHIRNIMGNAVFVPAVRIKTYVGAVIESSAGIEREKRTKSLLKRRDAVKFAKEDAEKIKKRLQGENAKYAITNDIESKRTIFKSKWFKWLEYLRRKNFDLLEKEDWWFLKAHYADALARLITVRKIDTNSIDAKTLETLRKYAINEAQVATYRDANAIADGLNQLQRKLERSDKKSLRATGVLIEGVMPFKKTPMNIAKQGINYSPVGILKGIYKGLAKVKKGDATATEVIDDISKGLTGTGMMLIGLFMASMGWLVGSDDKSKKEKEFDKMVGEQSYSIKIGDGTYTIDWMTPSNLSLFIGAKLFDLTKDEFTFGDVVSAVSTLAEPLLELSVFSGLNGVIESAQYSDSAPIVAVGSDMITSYLMQGLPTIGGQLSRLMDETKREYYYVDKNSDMPKELQTFIGQAASKIPFASYLFQPAIDEWGREETYGNVVERAFENTISPGYYAEDNYTRVDKEIRKLFEKTGDTAVLPTLQQKYYREDGVDYHMSPEDYTKVKKKRGKLSFQYVKELIYSDKYHSMSDEEKVEAIAKCYKTANKETKAEMLEKVKRKSKR